eukprot:gene11675-34397_t
MKLVAQATTGLQGKYAVPAKAVKSNLVATSIAARHRRVAFKPARIVRVAAAEPQDAEPSAEPPSSSARESAAAPTPLSSLVPGQELKGTVLSVQSFGAFVDIGAEKDGLVHISQLKSGFVGSVSEVVKIGDVVDVKVLTVGDDGRIALTMKGLNGDVAEGSSAPSSKSVSVSNAELQEGAEFEGTVTSVTGFGAFVNIGAEKDGLVHISQLGDTFVENAADVVSVGDVVRVRVLSNDGGKLSLTMKGGGDESEELDISPGDEFEGTVTKVESFGAFVDIGAGKDGLVHISQLADGFVADTSSVKEGDSVTVRVISYDASSGRIALTMKSSVEEASIDVQVGQRFDGTVTKVESFGCFVDIGSGKDGLVHVSQLSDDFVEDASSIVSVGQAVKVKVLSFDAATSRVALTMKNMDAVESTEGRTPAASLKKGDIFEGTVTQVSAFGAFVDVGADRDGLVHVSQLGTAEFVEDISTVISIGDKVKVKVLGWDAEKERLGLTMKNLDFGESTFLEPFNERVDAAKAKNELEAFMASCEPLDDENTPLKFFTVMDEDGDEDEYEAIDDHSFVLSEHEGDNEDSVESGLFFQMRDDEDLNELSTQALDALEAANPTDLDVKNLVDIPVPLQEMIEGKITFVDGNMMTVAFTHNGKECVGTLSKDEAKVPFGKIPALEQAMYAAKGALTVPASAKAILDGVISEEDGGAGKSDLKQTPAEYAAAFIDAVDAGTIAEDAMSPDEYSSMYNIGMLSYEAVAGAKLELAQVASGPAFVDADGRDLDAFYAVGDSVTAMVLAYNDWDEEASADIASNMIVLTMFPDWEVEQDAVDAAVAKADGQVDRNAFNDDAELNFTDDEAAERFLDQESSMAVDDSEGMDLYGLDPMEMLVDEMEINEEGSSGIFDYEDAAAEADATVASAVAEADAEEEDAEDAMFTVDNVEVQGVMQNMKRSGVFFAGSGSSGMINQGAFPNRELEEMDLDTVPIEYQRVYYSEGGDKSTLYDFWEDDFVAPTSRAYYQKIKMRVIFDENGEGELEEYAGEEGEETGEGEEAVALAVEDEENDLTYVLNPEHDQMVADLVRALLDDQEEEAEVAVRAYRSPVVLAAAATTISAADVKNLRTKTGAGMMSCKKALAECNGDVDAAIEWLRKKGLSGADKKAGRIAAEGGIFTYIHPGSRLGVMVEVNCETDFVAASDTFQSLAKSVAMQLAASPTVLYVSVEDIPAEVFEKEKAMEMLREDVKSKPENIRAKIAEGRAQKLAAEMALLPQPYLVDGSKTVEQAVKEAIAALGEKISIRRFVKFELGDGIEKKKDDFAAEVAAATGTA